MEGECSMQGGNEKFINISVGKPKKRYHFGDQGVDGKTKFICGAFNDTISKWLRRELG
jgi:hypothetical protein